MKNLPNIEIKEIGESIDWNIRPLSSKAKYQALNQTAYLIDLYNIYYERIFEKYSQGCDLYVNIIKNCESDAKVNSFHQVSR